MKILLTNDDGIEAPGLRSLTEGLEAVLRDESCRAKIFGAAAAKAEILVAAPDRGRSECGHSVTMGRPLTTAALGANRFSVDGTPVDCVRAYAIPLGVDAVLSGVNAGANLGIDLLVSGTFAAAREAASHGIPALALSHYRHPAVPKTWDHVPSWIRETLVDFLSGVVRFQHEPDHAPGVSAAPLWNVNLPATDPDGPVPTRVVCDVDPSPHRREVRHENGHVMLDMNFQDRPRAVGSDVDQCFSGNITISRLNFNVV